MVRQVRTTQRQPGLLFARPVPGRGGKPSATGLLPLGLDDRRDGVVYVPTTYRPDVASPLSSSTAPAATAVPGLARPDVGSHLWRVRPGRGVLDAALDQVLGRYAIDPRRVSIEGFSDGASYALSLGVANGDLFSKIVAFSPGFLAPGRMHGRPAIFVSHGVHDRVLPIDRCSRRLVLELQVAGYSVEYREFDGGHTVPEEIAAEAEVWVAT